MNINQLTIGDISTTIKSLISQFEHQDRITKIGIFGSVARGEATDESDIDFVVDFQYRHDNSPPQVIAEVKRQYEFEALLQQAFLPIPSSIVILEGVYSAFDHNFKEEVERDVVWVYEQ